LGLADRNTIMERGIDGTRVYLIRVSFLEKDEEELGLCDDPDVKPRPPSDYLLW
jgi:hypothetical protein